MPSSPPDFPLFTILRAVREHLGMDAVFLTRVRDGTEVWLAGDGGVERFGPVREGASLPVAETYCRHVVESDQLSVVLDTAGSELARRLAVTRTAGIGAYVGAAVRLRDGTVYGTLCCLSRNPSPAIGDQRLALVESLAEIAGAWLDDARLSEHQLRARHATARAQASRGGDAATLSERESARSWRASPRASRSNRSRRTSASAPTPSATICATPTRSWASRPRPPRSRRRCASG